MREYAIQNGIYLEIINGYDDHCHCLVSLSRTQSLAEVMHLIKGESANWINSNKLCHDTFEWQDQYFAISVSESILPRLRKYILNQENHHKEKTFKDEFDRIVREHGFSIKKFD